MSTSHADDIALTRLRRLALAEGLSFLVILLVTMPLKYGLDVAAPNRYAGMLHGLLFVGYVVYLGWLWAERRWPWRVLAWGLAASVVPFLVFWVERRVFAGLPQRGESSAGV